MTAGTAGSLPSTPATVTAANPAKDKFKWEISGLKAGSNNVTFNSKGKEAVHLILAVPGQGQGAAAEPDQEGSGLARPAPAVRGRQERSVDGDPRRRRIADDVTRPEEAGQYIFFCPLSDRDGGKPHFEEGLLKVQTVK